MSAGTRAAVGQPMCTVSASLLGPDESSPDDHVARAATREMVEQAGLVLVMEREQRGEIARLAPGTQARVSPPQEAARLAEGAGVRIRGGAARSQDLAELARLLPSVRGFRAPPAPPEPKRRPWWRKAEEPPDPLTIVDGHGGPEP